MVEKPIMSSSDIDNEFDAAVEKAMKDWHIPGLSVSVVHNEKTWSKGYGLAQISPSAEKKVEPTTLFYAASTTKAQLCAAWAIYMRSEENQSKPKDERVTWTTPLVNLIGDDFKLEDPVTTRQITLEDAVSHRTGMPRHDLSYGKEGPSTAKAVTRNLRNLPPHNTLRTNFEYCNTMYIAASHALETVTGKHLSQIFREWLWEPLGMKQTYLGFKEAEKAMQERGETLAKGHYWSKLPGSDDYKNGEYNEKPWMDFPEVSGAGEVISTANDYTKWMRCLLSKSAPLSEEIIKEVWTPRSLVTEENDMHVPFDGNMLSYGLGWFICSYHGHKVLYHPGGIIGAGSLVVLVPDLHWGMSFFGNGNEVGMTLRGLPFVLLDRVLGLPKDEPAGLQQAEAAVLKQFGKMAEASRDGRKKLYPNAPSSPTVPLTLPIEDYAGTYRSKAFGRLTFSVKEDDGEKVLYFLAENRTWGPQITLEHVNAEYWLGWTQIAGSAYRSPFRAESRAGVDGKVKEMGLVMEQAMAEHLMWFTRHE